MAQAPVATMILNRNLPEVTNSLVEHLKKWNEGLTDTYVIESGSDKDKLSKYCSFWANWPEALENGLRWARGFNYGLLELDKNSKRYDYYFLLMGDSVFDEQPTLERMLAVMTEHQKIGLLSPLSPLWSDAQLFSRNESLKCLYLFPHVSWLFRRSLLDALTPANPTIMNYLYDGNNFRGYYDDIEVIVRAYQANFASAITSNATFREAEELTLQHAKAMKTDEQALSRQMMYEEGVVWMKEKYGFTKGQFKEWAQKEYESFMRRNPEYQSLGLLEIAQ